jgi:hypothetical protein
MVAAWAGLLHAWVSFSLTYHAQTVCVNARLALMGQTARATRSLKGNGAVTKINGERPCGERGIAQNAGNLDPLAGAEGTQIDR